MEYEHFKDRNAINNKSKYEDEAAKLLEQLESFMKMFEHPYDTEAREETTNRSKCEGFKEQTAEPKKSERRFCKCLYATNNDKVTKNCSNCILANQQSNGYHCAIGGNFKVVWYEYVPILGKGSHIGNVDLILADDSFIYLTEVKPATGNEETLLRMFAEIETYYREVLKGKDTQQYKEVFGDKPIRKAILFIENSPQHKAYKDGAENTKKLLRLFGITVFLAKFEEGKVKINAIA